MLLAPTLQIKYIFKNIEGVKKYKYKDVYCGDPEFILTELWPKNETQRKTGSWFSGHKSVNS